MKQRAKVTFYLFFFFLTKTNLWLSLRLVKRRMLEWSNIVIVHIRIDIAKESSSSWNREAATAPYKLIMRLRSCYQQEEVRIKGIWCWLALAYHGQRPSFYRGWQLKWWFVIGKRLRFLAILGLELEFILLLEEAKCHCFSCQHFFSESPFWTWINRQNFEIHT